jgi:hypothetical protein
MINNQENFNAEVIETYSVASVAFKEKTSLNRTRFQNELRKRQSVIKNGKSCSAKVL